MGQKTNPNILRLGQNKRMKSKYIEKKSNELPNYALNDIEIQKFIYKFFDQNGLIVDNCKLLQSKNFLPIFVSYFSLPKTKQLIVQTNKHQKVKLKFKKRKSIKFFFKS